MIKILQRSLKRASIIFSTSILLQLILGSHLTNKTLWENFALSLAISFLLLAFFKETPFDYSIPLQLGFLVLAWIFVIIANYIFHWSYKTKDFLIALLVVLLSYLIIRLMTYYKVKEEVNEMNLFLNQRKKDS